ncbi:MAG: T9SS type A sorting domain-containing protein [Bacteroidia bacterium]
MKTKLSLSIILLTMFFIFEKMNAQAPSWGWVKSAGGITSDEGYGITTDASGNVLVTGVINSPSITFGAITLTNAGSYDFFVAKYDASGNVLWAKSAGGINSDYGTGITTDASGNVLVTGVFNSPSITFGTITLSNGGLSDIFVVKYDASGNVLWAKSAGGASYEGGTGISTDATGNVLVTGFFQSDSIAFGTTTLTNAGAVNFFVVKYDTSGNILWAKSAGGSDYDYGHGISTDASGNVLVAGEFASPSITFGTTTLTNAGNQDIFITKCDTLGNILWAKSAGGTKNDVGYSISSDASGNVLVTGIFYSPFITFATTTLTNSGYNDIFIVKYDVSGNVLWAKSAGGTYFDESYGICTDASGNVLLTGYFSSDSITFGTTTLTNVGTTATADIFIVKYDASGNVQWAKSEGEPDNDVGYSASTDPGGNVVITGSFASPTITFGTTTLTNAGVTDIFVAKLDNTTGISELNSTADGVSIYPNPSTGQITITSSKIIDDVTITNPLGQVIYQSKPKDKNLSLKIKDDGIYFVTITSDKKTSTRKIIVQH